MPPTNCSKFLPLEASSNRSCLFVRARLRSCALQVPLWTGFSPEGSWRSKASQRLKPVETKLFVSTWLKSHVLGTTYPQRSCETQKSDLIAFGKMQIGRASCR